jgi:hypothetical protein
LVKNCCSAAIIDQIRFACRFCKRKEKKQVRRLIRSKAAFSAKIPAPRPFFQSQKVHSLSSLGRGTESGIVPFDGKREKTSLQ